MPAEGGEEGGGGSDFDPGEWRVEAPKKFPTSGRALIRAALRFASLGPGILFLWGLLSFVLIHGVNIYAGIYRSS